MKLQQLSYLSKIILITCLTTSFLPATTIKFINYTKNYYTAHLSLTIDTFDATDVIHISPGEHVERLYNTKNVYFPRLIIENEHGIIRTYNDPFTASANDVWLVKLYAKSIEITYLL